MMEFKELNQYVDLNTNDLSEIQGGYNKLAGRAGAAGHMFYRVGKGLKWLKYLPK